MKIYLVSGEFSSWDLFHTKNLKAFNTKEDAEKYVEKAERILGEFSKHLNRCYSMQQDLEDKARKSEDYDQFEKDLEELENSDKYKTAETIYMTHYNLQEFNKCVIEEIELK